MTRFSTLTDDQLAAEIATWSGRIAAGEAHLLALIGEFDRREAWGGPGLLSCAHWLTWRTGLGLTAARERVRVARALADLPDVQAAFSVGRMSWSQVQAVTRVASADDGVDWVALPRHASGSQLERICRGVRRARKATEAAADAELAAYRMRTTKRYAEDGTLVITIRANAEDGAACWPVWRRCAPTSNGAVRPSRTIPRNRQPERRSRPRCGSTTIPPRSPTARRAALFARTGAIPRNRHSPPRCPTRRPSRTASPTPTPCWKWPGARSTRSRASTATSRAVPVRR